MTSKNLFFKLMRENAKRQLWIIALSILTFFFSFPVTMAMICGNRDEYSYLEPEVAMERILRDARLVVLNDNGWIVFLMIVAALLCGVSSFSYLHSKKKVDFFHSIPVRRETLFGVSYLNGILIVAVPYLLNLLLALAIMAMNGLNASSLVEMALKTYVFHMVYFLLLYAVVVVAMMMTGNIVIGILGNAVFSLYVPCVTLLILGCSSTFLRTFFYQGSFDWSTLTEKFYHISPFTSYILNFTKWNNGGDIIFSTGIAFISAIAITALALWLYRIRPSEAAGKAMAFVRTQPFIKILIVIPSTIAGGLFFWALRGSDGWGIFGMICGLLLSYCIIEIIYNFDFRKLFAHKLHLGFCGIAASLIMAVFRFDLLGFDSYLPKESSIESSSIYITELDSWMDYRDLELHEIEGLEPSVSWTYKNSIGNAFKNMKITSSAEILTIARAGIAELDEELERDSYYSNGRNSGEEEDLYSRVYIQYHLKDGRKPVRAYVVNITNIMEEVDRLYQNPEYKQGIFPILSLGTDEIAGVNYEEKKEYSHVVLNEDGSDKKALLEAYQSDLKALSLETRKKESPICTLQFKTNEMQYAIDVLRASGSNEWTYYNDVAYYPVYPSFTQTIDILKRTGIEAGQESGNLTDIVRIEIENGYRTRDYKKLEDTEYEPYTIVVSNKDEINQVLDAAIWYNYAHMNTLNRTKEIDIRFYKKNTNPNTDVNEEFEKYDSYYNLDVDKIPAFMQKQTTLWQ